MSEFEIEDGVPIPARRNGLKPTWPWPEMGVAQSVFIPAQKGETGSRSGSDTVSIYRRVNPYGYAAQHKKVFQTRWMKHKGKAGLRIWRTK